MPYQQGGDLMGLLDTFRKRVQPTSEAEVDSPACPHTVLIPKWDRLEDMGKEESIAGFRCDACGQEFTTGEGEHLLAQEKQRLEAEVLSRDVDEAR